MSEKNEQFTTGKKLSAFLEKNIIATISIVVGIIILLVAFICVENGLSKLTVKNLTKLDAITYELTNGSASLEDQALADRRSVALEQINELTNKSGIVGVRANMLAAELSYQEKDLDSMVNYWQAAAKKAKKSYLAPLAYYNLASAYEQLGNLDEACQNYKLASEFDEFILRNHAKFSYARVLEIQGKNADAIEAYNDLYANNPDDSWALLAKTRVIALQIQEDNN